MSLLRKLGNLWLGMSYGRQSARRVAKGIHRAAAVSARSCANCRHASGSGLTSYRRCTPRKLLVHRADICNKFCFPSKD